MTEFGIHTDMKLCVIASITPKTLYLFLPEGVAINTLTMHQTQAIKAPCTKWAASAK